MLTSEKISILKISLEGRKGNSAVLFSNIIINYF